MALIHHERLADDKQRVALERAARIQGLCLERLELLGQHPRLAERFVDSVRAGRAQAFLGGSDWERLRCRPAGHGLACVPAGAAV